MNLRFESDRLFFRPLEETDLDLLRQQWMDPAVVEFTGGRLSSEQELIADMPVVTRRCAGGCIGNWCLVERSTREKLGTANLLPMPVDLDDTDWDLVSGDSIPEGDIEIGYVLKRTAWGQGYATEACDRLVRFAFEESPLQEIIASIVIGNTASQRVLEKNGFSAIGLIQSYGEPSPGFRLTRQEWERAQRLTGPVQMTEG
ncbi:MAG: GNAT family N-acetyltransferase [Pseudomonadota bacterium]